jgi:hypothetical protein
MRGITPYRLHLFNCSVSVNHHFSCIFCQTPLEAHQGMVNQTPTNVGLTGNNNTKNLFQRH